MAMTVVVTRNASGRIRGYLTSCMCEIAPGVYTAPTMNVSLRTHVWNVLTSWWSPRDDVSIVMTWPEKSAPGHQRILTLGSPRTEVVVLDGVHASRRDLPTALASVLAR